MQQEANDSIRKIKDRTYINVEVAAIQKKGKSNYNVNKKWV